MSNLENIINEAFDNRADFDSKTVSAEIRSAVEQALALLDSGEGRVAEKKDGEWVVNKWLKKAVLLSFKINDNRVMDGDNNGYYDKVETKFANYSE
ncbi:MAG: 2,3,4,5-tetrahydropyridine-2,6-dicarboxylate N-succinyltransferase, partial [Cycloclasticus sp.]|nr:2,3,4,5-tetrahydropyridine-2,6-dicarboxylate N-succinyltransferase [Cycloclasticus sp.]